MYVYNEVFSSARSILLYPSGGRAGEATKGHFPAADHGCETAYIELFDDAGKASLPFVQAKLAALVAAFASKAGGGYHADLTA